MTEITTQTGEQIYQLTAEELAHYENMARILRERANADRGLEPKKQRTGFIVLRAADNTFSCRVRNATYSATLRGGQKITLQTWYKGDFSRADVAIQWEHDCPNVLAALGLNAIQTEDWTSKRTSSDGVREEWAAAAGLAYAPQFIYDGRSGYWQVEFRTTSPITSLEI